MKKAILFVIILISEKFLLAQPTQQQRIEDSVIGWYSNPNFFENVKKNADALYTSKVNIAYKFVEWMQKSFTPVASLGTYMRYTSKSSYGATFRTYNPFFTALDSKGHFKPDGDNFDTYLILANSFKGIYGIKFLNTEDKYYFTWPPDGYCDEAIQEKQKNDDPRIHPNAYKYITRVNEFVTVYLVPNNKLPIIPITKGEYLSLVEASYEKALLDEREEVKQNNSHRTQKEQDEIFEYRKKDLEKYKSFIPKWREKYKNSLNEPAELVNFQPTFRNLDFDPFEISEYERKRKAYFPVYQLDPAVMEKTRADKPQWIVISVLYANKESGTQAYERYKAVTENINYDYIYNYFFDPEKLKGKAYTPANEEALKARQDTYRKRIYWTNPNANKTLPHNVHFMDDFSMGELGGKPYGWFCDSKGQPCTLTTIKGQTGRWVQLGYNKRFSPNTSLKKPLPQNFTIEYDVVAVNDFSKDRGGKAILRLSNIPLKPLSGEDMTPKNNTALTVEVSAGNDADLTKNTYNFGGKVSVTMEKYPEDYRNAIRIEASKMEKNFTSKKNKIHVALKINNGALQLFINGNNVITTADLKIYNGESCGTCLLPPGTVFNELYFQNSNSESRTDPEKNIYIGNIKIIKE